MQGALTARSKSSPIWRYGLAVALVAASLTLTLFLESTFSNRFWFLFFAPGRWEAIDVELSSPGEIYITPYSGTGHSVIFPGRKQTVRMKYDGKEYPETGPTVPEESSSSGRRIDANTIETTERIKGKVIETARSTVSADGQTQTIVVSEPGDPTPVVLVYAREK